MSQLQRRVRQFPQQFTKIKVDISKVPDWGRRATRLGLAIAFFGLLGHCTPWSPEHKELASNFRQSCNWAAITCIVVTAPLIGKVAQVAFDRLLGTAVGGFIGFLIFFIGFHAFGDYGAGVFVSLFGGFLLVPVTVYGAYKHNLDQLARFVQLTFCIIAFGAKPGKGADLLALLRVGGIFAGGVFSVVLAVLVLPRSASVESLREMKKAMKALLDLNKEVWASSNIANNDHHVKHRARKHHRHGYSALGLADLRARSPAANGTLHGSHASAEHLAMLVQHDDEVDQREAATEKLFTSVYTTLAKVDENLAQTDGEIYIWHFWGRYFFLPGVHWFPVTSRWRVPKKDLEQLATCLRRIARMLWTLLLDFEEGFDEAMATILQQYYPKQLLSEMAVYQHKALTDLLRAFPEEQTIEVDNLFTLGQVVDCLMQISDARARDAVFSVKRRKSVARQPSSALKSVTVRGTTVRVSSVDAVAGSVPDGQTEQQPLLAGQQATVSTATEWRPADVPGDRSVEVGTAARGVAATSVAPSMRVGPGVAEDGERVPLLQRNAVQQPQQQASPHTSSDGTAAASAVPAGSTANAAASISRWPSSDPAGTAAASKQEQQHHQAGHASNGNPTLPTAAGVTGSPGLGIGAAASAVRVSGAGAGGAPASGVFLSRLLSPAHHQQVLLDAPPRRLMKALQQQQQQGQRQAASAGDGSITQPAAGSSSQQEGPATEARISSPQGSLDILGGLSFAASPERTCAQLAVLPASAYPSAAGRTEPSAGALGEAHPANASQSSAAPQHQQQDRLTALGTAAVALSEVGLASLGRPPRAPQAAGDDRSVRRQLATIPSEGNIAEPDEELPAPTSMGPSPFQTFAHRRLSSASGGGRPSVEAATPTHNSSATGNPFSGRAPPEPLDAPHDREARPRAIPGVGHTAPAPDAATMAASGAADSEAAANDSRPAAAVGTAPPPPVPAALADADRLLSAFSSYAWAAASASATFAVEPVTFPPTEEGYISQVRWYSFQFVMDELVEEMEEAFQACSAVLQQLPYPIGN